MPRVCWDYIVLRDAERTMHVSKLERYKHSVPTFEDNQQALGARDRQI